MDAVIRRMALLLALALLAACLVPSLAEELAAAEEEVLVAEGEPSDAAGNDIQDEQAIQLEDSEELDSLSAGEVEGAVSNAISDQEFEDGPEGAAVAKQLTLKAKKITLGVGEQFSLGATLLDGDGQIVEGSLKYKSAKTKYAKVNSKGVVTGKKKGSTKITVTGPNGLKAVCKVTVRKAPGSVKVSAKQPKLAYVPEAAEGDSTTLKVTLPSGSASAITYTDYDPAVVQVSEDGKVTAVGYGATFITARTFNGKKAKCAVRVIDPDNLSIECVAHRGGAGHWPENTLEAFANAGSTGATAVELDVQTTKDGIQVVHHYKEIVCKGKKYKIEKYKYSKLRKLKPSLCTLDEALEVISATGLDLYLELKKTANAKKCVAAVKKWGMTDRTMYISMLTSQLKKVRKQDGSARLAFIIEGKVPDVAPIHASLKLTAVGQDKEDLTRSNIIKWQNLGLQVNVWRVLKTSDIEKYLDWGVDSITSDYPDRVTEVLNR